MSAFPITIFSRASDLSGVAALLRNMAPTAKIVGPDHAWERISIEQPQGWFRKPAVLVFKHNREYYSGPDWPKQVSGMQAYVSKFPDVPRKSEILRVITSFRFALATEFNPDLFLETDDPRLQFLYAVARHLDAAIFIPPGFGMPPAAP